MTFLLDTNICIAILNDSTSRPAKILADHSPEDVHLCSIVKAELIYGAHRSSRAAENLALLERFFTPFASLPFDDEAAAILGRERSRLAQLGTPIGPYDLIIAATALRHGATVVTHNVREFERIPTLRWVDWLAPSAGG